MIERLWIKDLRNINELHLNLHPHNHCYIYGKNNHGKTSILEALYLSTRAESPIQDDRKKLVMEGKKEALVGVDISSENATRLYCKIDDLGKRTVFLNNKKMAAFKRLSELIYIDYISADVLHFFQKDASFRRKQLDRFCSDYFVDYYELLKEYEGVCKQKNRLLKQERFDLSILDIYNEQMVERGCKIVKKRQEALHLISTKMKAKLQELNLDKCHELELYYCQKRLEGISEEAYAAAWRKQLEQDREKEAILGYSLTGPQRDDVELTIQQKKVTDFCSRGINRMMAFLFKLACIDVIKAEKQRSCCLLLDDTLAEIDSENKEKMIQLLLVYEQVIFVTTEKHDYDYFSDTSLYCVNEGVLQHA